MNTIEMQIEIERLKNNRSEEWILMKDQWQETLHNINISALVKKSVEQLFTAKPTNNTLFVSVLGLSAKYVINKLYSENPRGLMSKISKLGFEYMASKFIVNHSHQLIIFGCHMIKSFINKTKIHSYEKINK